MKLFGSYDKMIDKNKNKDVDRHCLKKTLKKRKNTHLKDFNGYKYSVKKSVAIKPKYYVNKN